MKAQESCRFQHGGQRGWRDELKRLGEKIRIVVLHPHGGSPVRTSVGDLWNLWGMGKEHRNVAGAGCVA